MIWIKTRRIKNLCLDKSYSDKAHEIKRNIETLGSSPIEKDIIASQQRRHFVQRVLVKGNCKPWDFQPTFDASKQYLRTGNSPTAVKGLARYPFVSPKKPDTPRQSDQKTELAGKPQRIELTGWSSALLNFQTIK